MIKASWNPDTLLLKSSEDIYFRHSLFRHSKTTEGLCIPNPGETQSSDVEFNFAERLVTLDLLGFQELSRTSYCYRQTYQLCECSKVMADFDSASMLSQCQPSKHFVSESEATRHVVLATLCRASATGTIWADGPSGKGAQLPTKQIPKREKSKQDEAHEPECRHECWQTETILICHISSKLTCETPWVHTLMWHSCRTPLLDTIAQRSGETLLLDTLVRHSCKTLLTWHSCKTLLLDIIVRHSYLTQITHTDTAFANAKETAATQITHTDTSCTNANITAATQITHTDTSSADTNITAATQITHTDTSSTNANKTAATQITHTDTSSANAKITAATQITHTDSSSADTKITVATQITHADTSSANANITAATQITHTDTSSANANITAATQINHTDTSSADTNITAATQIAHTDTSSADTNIADYSCGDNGWTSHTFRTTPDVLATVASLSHSHKRLRRSCRRLRTVANGCGRLRTVADTDTTFREHSLIPRPPNETGTLATHSGKTRWSPRTRTPTRMLRNSYLFVTISSEPTCGTPWLDTLRWHSCRTTLLETIVIRSGKPLLLDTLISRSCGALLLDTLLRHSYLTLL